MKLAILVVGIVILVVGIVASRLLCGLSTSASEQQTTTDASNPSLLEQTKSLKEQHSNAVGSKTLARCDGETDSGKLREKIRILGPEKLTVPLDSDVRTWLLLKGNEQLRLENPEWEVVQNIVICLTRQPPSDDIVSLMRAILKKPVTCKKVDDRINNGAVYMALCVLAEQGTPEAMRLLKTVALVFNGLPADLLPLLPGDSCAGISDNLKKVYFRVVCGSVCDLSPKPQVLPFFEDIAKSYGEQFQLKRELDFYLDCAHRITVSAPHPLGPPIVD